MGADPVKDVYVEVRRAACHVACTMNSWVEGWRGPDARGTLVSAVAALRLAARDGVCDDEPDSVLFGAEGRSILRLAAARGVRLTRDLNRALRARLEAAAADVERLVAGVDHDTEIDVTDGLCSLFWAARNVADGLAGGIACQHVPS